MLGWKPIVESHAVNRIDTAPRVPSHMLGPPRTDGEALAGQRRLGCRAQRGCDDASRLGACDFSGDYRGTANWRVKPCHLLGGLLYITCSA